EALPGTGDVGTVRRAVAADRVAVGAAVLLRRGAADRHVHGRPRRGGLAAARKKCEPEHCERGGAEHARLCGWCAGPCNCKTHGGVTSLPRVLVVEDDAAIRGMLTTALRREPLVVDGAQDGVGALEKLAAETYNVIVVDLMMPRLDGYGFLEAFRHLTLPLRPVVFVMTAYDDAA